MAIELSKNAELLLAANATRPQVIIEIEGIDAVFGTASVKRYARIGEDNLTIGNFIIGGTIEDEDSKAYISAKGTSNRVSRQILQDQGGTSSTTRFKAKIVDKNGEVTAALSPGNQVDDPMGQRATVYLGFADGAHPEDSIPILYGLIDEISFGPGFANISISHPERFKRREIYPSIETEIDGAIDSSQTTITLKSTSGLLLPQDDFTTHVRINDEIIQYSGISGNDLTGCSRGAIGTSQTSHDDEDTVSSFYRLQGNAIDLALKLQLSSDSKTFFAEGIEVNSLGYVSPTLKPNNAIFFSGEDIQEKWGLVEGDFVTVENSAIGANNVTLAEITGFATTNDGSYLLTDATFTSEATTDATCSFKSKYNVLPDGCGMGGHTVDVARFEEFLDFFASNIPDFDFYIEDEINAKEFIDEKIFFPAAMYSVPRKGKASVNINMPPLARENLLVLNESNIVNPESIQISRSINEKFYNAILWKYDKYALEDKFLGGELRVNEDSQNTIPIGNKVMKIESPGMRRGTEADLIVVELSRRLLARYRYGAEFIKDVKLLPKDALKIEVGDIVGFGSPSLQIADTTRGDRDFDLRLMEVYNTSYNWANGDYKIDLVDTNYKNDVRYWVISPSSELSSQSTTTKLILKKSFGTKETGIERNKWSNYVGKKIRVISPDLTTFDEITKITAFPQDNDQAIEIEALPSAPLDGYFIEVPRYDEAETVHKTVFGFLGATVEITSGIDSTSFEVDSSEISKFFVGGKVRVHTISGSDEFDQYNEERIEIDDITGNVITLKEGLGFTPSNGDLVDLMGFSDDEGDPYFYL